MNTTTRDLGNGWWLEWQRAKPGIGTSVYATYEVMTFRNADKGQRIDLPAESIATLRAILAAVSP